MGSLRIRTTKGNHLWKCVREEFDELESKVMESGKEWLCLSANTSNDRTVIRIDSILALEFFVDSDSLS